MSNKESHRNHQNTMLRKQAFGYKRKDKEEEFLHAAENGDVPTIKTILRNHPDFNVDCEDILGRTPLRLAVTSEHLQVVKLILDLSGIKNIYDSLLLSISLDRDQITEHFLNHQRYDEVQRYAEERTMDLTKQSEVDSLFDPGTVPIVLAAQKNQYEIVKRLLLMGDDIEEPHDYFCRCDFCEDQQSFDRLRFFKYRLNIYRALGSKAYVSLASDDPILTAFQLARKLRKIADIEKYFKLEYETLAQNLSDLAVGLLDFVRTSEELDVILHRKQGTDLERNEKLARLKLAVYYKEIKFIGHPICQRKLTTFWYSNQHVLQKASLLRMCALSALYIAAYPLFVLIYWFNPFAKITEYMRIPYLKFVASSISYVTFLLLIMVFSFQEVKGQLPHFIHDNPTVAQFYSQYERHLSDQMKMQINCILRYFDFSPYIIVLYIFVLGSIIQECKDIYSSKFGFFFNSFYNILDFLMLALYQTWFMLRVIATYKAWVAYNFFMEESGWQKLVLNTTEAVENAYWVNMDRRFWQNDDPFLVSESLFGIANVFSFTRLSYLLAVSEIFGPLQITLVKLTKDVLKFLLLFLMLFIAFLVGLQNIYWYYLEEHRRFAEYYPNTIKTKAAHAFGNAEYTFRTLYWAIFGMEEFTVVELGEYGDQPGRRTGYLIFGLYNFIFVIILINMFIAMMTRTYESIASRQDLEWKYARTILYLDYIEDTHTLSVPFNLIPSWGVLTRICCRKRYQADMEARKEKERRDSRKPDKEDELNGNNLEPPITSLEKSMENVKIPTNYLKYPRKSLTGSHLFIKLEQANKDDVERPPTEPNDVTLKMTPDGHVDEDEDGKSRYKDVIRKVVQRYIFQGKEDKTGAASGIEEVKQDISNFRYEIMNAVTEGNYERSRLNEKVMEFMSDSTTIVQKLDRLLAKQHAGSRRASQITINEASMESLASESVHTDESVCTEL